MSSLVTVLTCERSHNYLEDTLRSLDEAGAKHHERLVISDGWDVPRSMLGDWPAKVYPKAGAKKLLWKAFEEAAARDCERLLFFEDDVRACKNAVTRMVAQKVPQGVPLISFFDLGVTFESAGIPQVAPGLYRVPMHAFMSACALLFPRETFLRLKDIAPPGPPDVPWCKENDMDTALNHLLWHSGDKLSYGLHMPSLVQHMGDVSVARPGDVRRQRAPSYQGDDFDALALQPFASWAGFVILSLAKE